MTKYWINSETTVDINEAEDVNVVHFTVDDKNVAVSAGQTVYEALQRGIVDGVIGSVHDRWAWGEKGVYKYIMQPGCMEASTYMFISAKVWDGLPSDVKSLLKDVAQDVQNAGFFWVKEWEDEALQNYIKEGVQTFQLSREDEQKVAKAFRRDYLQWLAEQSPDYGARLFKLLEPYI